MSRFGTLTVLALLFVESGWAAASGKVSESGQKAIDALVHHITEIEAGGNCQAKNPLDTTAGLGLFMESAWLRLVAEHKPGLAQGKNKNDILALRFDCDLAREMLVIELAEFAAYLEAEEVQATPGNLYLAHFLGPKGAHRILTADRAAMISDVLGSEVTKANPFLDGKTVEWLRQWADRKMARSP